MDRQLDEQTSARVAQNVFTAQGIDLQERALEVQQQIEAGRLDLEKKSEAHGVREAVCPAALSQ